MGVIATFQAINTTTKTGWISGSLWISALLWYSVVAKSRKEPCILHRTRKSNLLRCRFSSVHHHHVQQDPHLRAGARRRHLRGRSREEGRKLVLEGKPTEPVYLVRPGRPPPRPVDMTRLLCVCVCVYSGPRGFSRKEYHARILSCDPIVFLTFSSTTTTTTMPFFYFCAAHGDPHGVL